MLRGSVCRRSPFLHVFRLQALCVKAAGLLLYSNVFRLQALYVFLNVQYLGCRLCSGTAMYPMNIDSTPAYIDKECC